MTDARPSARLAAARAAVPRAIALSAALPAADPSAPVAKTRRRGAKAETPAPVSAPPEGAPDDDDPDAGGEADLAPVKTPAAERRRGVEVLLGLWADVTRDLVLVGAGGARSVHDTVLLEELTAISAAIAPGAAATFLARAARSGDLLVGNVSPELVLDSLVLGWPVRVAAA
jgi:hypothetical protein